MQRGDFLRLVLLAPLAKLVGWEQTSPPLAVNTEQYPAGVIFALKNDWDNTVTYSASGGTLTPTHYWIQDASADEDDPGGLIAYGEFDDGEPTR